MGQVDVVVGGQFGSEAKGKTVAYLANGYALAIRSGGPNAGHTVIHNGTTYKVRQVSAAFVNPNAELALAAGALIDPEVLAQEVAHTGVADRLTVDPAAGLITQAHKNAEQAITQSISSTGTGTGASLMGRIGRTGYVLAGEGLKGYRQTPVSERANALVDKGARVLLEGSQGFGLSLYHGTYPHVTSRDTSASGLLSEVGLSPRMVGDIYMVVRTYPIRVGGPSGPLEGELSWDELSRRVGKPLVEHSTVTKKVRRIAALDVALVQRAVQVNRPTCVVLTFFDYLFPDLAGANDWSQLTPAAKSKVEELERAFGAPIGLISTGPATDAMIDRRA